MTFVDNSACLMRSEVGFESRETCRYLSGAEQSYFVALDEKSPGTSITQERLTAADATADSPLSPPTII